MHTQSESRLSSVLNVCKKSETGPSAEVYIHTYKANACTHEVFTMRVLKVKPKMCNAFEGREKHVCLVHTLHIMGKHSIHIVYTVHVMRATAGWPSAKLGLQLCAEIL